MDSILWNLPALGHLPRRVFDNWAVKLVTAPSIEPVSLDEQKSHSRVAVFPDDDDDIELYIQAAREHCEQETFRAFITQEWDFWLPCWPASNRIKIPFPALQQVEYVKYTDLTETVNTLDPSIYVVQTGAEPGEVVLRFGQIWPPGPLSPSWPVNIRFRAGWGDDATTVPAKIKQAIRMLAGHWYENREAMVVGKTSQIATEIKWSVDTLLSHYRVETHGFSQVRSFDPSVMVLG